MAKKPTKKNLCPPAAFQEQISALLWSSPDKGGKIADALLRQMASAVPLLVEQLSEENDSSATQAFFALEAMVLRCLNPESFEEGLELAELLLENLDSARDSYSRHQLIRFIGLIGADEAADALSPGLEEPEDFEVTLLALRNIGTDCAFENIVQKLLQSQGREFFALAIALGDWECNGILEEKLLRRHLPEILPEELPGLWKACAECRESWLAPDLLQALQGTSKVLAGAARAALHTLVISLENEEAIELAQKFYTQDPSPIALQTWFHCCHFDLSQNCFGAILAATQSDNLPLRESALELLNYTCHNSVEIEQLIDIIIKISHPETKAAMVRMLGRHRDLIARPFVMSLLRDESPVVRLAALEAARNLQGHLPSANLQFLLAIEK